MVFNRMSSMISELNLKHLPIKWQTYASLPTFALAPFGREKPFKARVMCIRKYCDDDSSHSFTSKQSDSFRGDVKPTPFQFRLLLEHDEVPLLLLLEVVFQADFLFTELCASKRAIASVLLSNSSIIQTTWWTFRRIDAPYFVIKNLNATQRILNGKSICD